MRFFFRISATIVAAALIAACSAHSSLPLTGFASRQTQSERAQDTTLRYYAIAAPDAFPWSIIASQDGSIWFGDWADAVTSASPSDSGRVGHLANGVITEYVAGPATSSPILGAIGTDGAVWFSEFGASTGNMPGAFANVSAIGNVTTYPVPESTKTTPRFSTEAAGNVWYTLQHANKIDEVTPSGTITEFAVPATSQGQARPHDITVGPDGALWFTEWIGNAIGRMTTDGTITNVFMLPDVEAAPRFIASGADGALWFTEGGSQSFGDSFSPSRIVRITTSGDMTKFDLPLPGSTADFIRPAAGGLVFDDLGTNALGFIDYAGNISEYPFQAYGSAFGSANGVLQAADGSYYFADSDGHRIGQLTLGKKGIIMPQTFTVASGGTQLVGVAVAGDRGPYTAAISDQSCASVAPIAGFPLNFSVTGIAPGTCTLTIKGKGKILNAAITVVPASAALQSAARRNVQQTMNL